MAVGSKGDDGDIQSLSEIFAADRPESAPGEPAPAVQPPEVKRARQIKEVSGRIKGQEGINLGHASVERND